FQIVSLSPDGKTLATVSGLFSKSIELWDPATGKAKGALPGLDETVSAAAFTSDAKTLVTGDGDGEIGIWDIESRKLRKIFKATLDIVADTGSMANGLAVSPDGKVVYVAETSQLPESGTSKAKRMVKDREVKGNPNALAIGPKSQVLVEAGEEFRLWDAKTGK